MSRRWGGTQAFFHSGGRGGKELRQVLGLPDPTAKPVANAPPLVRTLTRFAFAMADGYQVYDIVMAEAGIRRLCCWTHGKRGFGLFEVDDPAAKTIADAIRVLYRIEHEVDRAISGARATGEAAIALRHQFRRDRAGPQLIEIRRLLDEAQPSYTVGSEMCKAIDYILDRWAAFAAYTGGVDPANLTPAALASRFPRPR